MKNSKSMNLLEGSLWDKILIFAIPYALTCVLEQLFNATDVAVVGRFVGNQAMGAVGANTPLLALIIGGISNVFFNLFYVLNSFGQACTTFTAQNNGAGNEERCKKSLGWSLLLGGIFTFITCVLMLIFGHPILSLFSKNEEVIEVGITRMEYIFAGYIFSLFQEVLAGALRGYGHSLIPALCALIVICGTRITWVHTYFKAHRTFAALVMAYPVSLSITAFAVAIVWIIYVHILNH